MRTETVFKTHTTHTHTNILQMAGEQITLPSPVWEEARGEQPSSGHGSQLLLLSQGSCRPCIHWTCIPAPTPKDSRGPADPPPDSPLTPSVLRRTEAERRGGALWLLGGQLYPGSLRHLTPEVTHRPSPTERPAGVSPGAETKGSTQGRSGQEHSCRQGQLWLCGP